MTGRSDTMDFRLDNDGENIVNKFSSLLESRKLDRFLEQDHVRTLLSHLNETIELDRLQFHRIPSADPCSGIWKIVKYLCKLANQSESVYKCISKEEWLRTVVESYRRHFRFISNVMPRQAYLMRLQNIRIVCPEGHRCTKGFFQTCYLREGSEPRRSCATCALADALTTEQPRGELLEKELLCLEKKDVVVESRLGGGSEGEVHKILWHKGIFARKRFPTYAVLDGESRDVSLGETLFDKEREVVRLVLHPNIVHCFGYSKDIKYSSQNQYLRRHSMESKWSCELSLYMELLEEDLEGYLLDLARMENSFSFRDTLHVLLQIAQAMEHLHERGIVHGDLKPSNILLSRLAMSHPDISGKFYLVKVADFGCTQRVDCNSGAIVGTFNHAIGTHVYTAPEVRSCRIPGGEPPEDPRKIDVYSFGIVAFQVLTRRATSTLYKYVDNSGLIRGTVERVGLEPERQALFSLILRCLAWPPEARSTFLDICREIRSRYFLIEHQERV